MYPNGAESGRGIEHWETPTLSLLHLHVSTGRRRRRRGQRVSASRASQTSAEKGRKVQSGEGEKTPVPGFPAYGIVQ